jgi:hypothetical protein
MRDGMVTAEGNQGLAGFQDARHVLLDQIPGIRMTIERDVTVIVKSPGDGEIDPRFAPGAVRVGVLLAPDQRRRFSGTLHERGVVVVGNPEEANAVQCGSVSYTSDANWPCLKPRLSAHSRKAARISRSEPRPCAARDRRPPTEGGQQ